MGGMLANDYHFFHGMHVVSRPYRIKCIAARITLLEHDMENEMEACTGFMGLE